MMIPSDRLIFRLDSQHNDLLERLDKLDHQILEVLDRWSSPESPEQESLTKETVSGKKNNTVSQK